MRPKTKSQSIKRVQGFTLIELLVVLAVVSILAGLIFSAFSSAREKARQTACLSNLKQLGIAVQAYAQDNNDFIPPYNSQFDGTLPNGVPMQDHGADLVACLSPYVHDRNIWFCPADIYARTSSTDGHINHLSTSYATGLAWWSSGWLLGKRTIDYPGSSSNQSSLVQGPVLFTDDLWNFKATPTDTPPTYSHNGRFNFVMFDGHVKSLSWQ